MGVVTSAGAGKDLRPFAATLTTTLVATTLLALAITAGWLGPDAGRGSEFCERWHDGCIKQPVNTFSNLGFVAAGLAIGWRARRVEARGRGPLRSTLVVGWMGSVTALLGPGSAAMHATGTELGGSLDLLSMHLIASFAVAYSVARRRAVSGRSPRFPLFFVLFLAFAQSATLVDGTVPVIHQPENVTFALLLVLMAVIELVPIRHAPSGQGAPRRSRPDRRWLAAAIGSLVVAFTIWNLAQGPWCDPDSWVQGHAVWHLLCALAAWFLFRFYASETFSGHGGASRAGG